MDGDATIAVLPTVPLAEIIVTPGRTILAADTVSLIGAIVLWWLTVGSVRGFAFFLGLSTMADMVVSYFFTRPAVLLLARTKLFNKGRVLGVARSTTSEAVA